MKRGMDVTVYEKAGQVGGLIQTRKTPQGLAESAAHALVASPAVTDLAKELDIELVESRVPSRDRYVYRDGRFKRLPLNSQELAGFVLRSFGFSSFKPGMLGEELTV